MPRKGSRIKKLDELDWTDAKKYRRVSDKLIVEAIEAPDSFEITLPYEAAVEMQEREVVKLKTQRTAMGGLMKWHEKVKEKHPVKVFKKLSGMIRGKKGDFICRSEQTGIFAVAKVDPKNKHAEIFARKFEPVVIEEEPVVVPD